MNLNEQEKIAFITRLRSFLEEGVRVGMGWLLDRVENFKRVHK